MAAPTTSTRGTPSSRRTSRSQGSGTPGGARPWLGQWDSAATSYYTLLGATSLLLLLGLVMVLSSSAVTSIASGASPYSAFLNQAQFAIIGLPVLVIAMRLPLRVYKAMAWPALFVALALLVYVMFAGDLVGGNRNWVVLGPVRFQPSELAKLALAVWLGAVLGRKQRLLGRWSQVLWPAVPGAVLVVGLVLAGHDLGTALVIIALAMGAFWVAGASAKLLFLGSGLAAVIVGWVFIFGQSSGDRLGRIFATYGSCVDPQGECYQSIHGLYALGSGGVLGLGLGASREKWRYLPEAHNDFIYAVIGEELGLLGTLMVLGLFVALGLAMSRVVRRHPDPFVKITTAAVACWVVGQAFVNIGVVIGVLPVIGVPLPLVSAGGSALVTTMAGLGMVISFARSEPGAAEALAARGSVVRRTVTVLGRSRREAHGGSRRARSAGSPR